MFSYYSHNTSLHSRPRFTQASPNNVRVFCGTQKYEELKIARWCFSLFPRIYSDLVLLLTLKCPFPNVANPCADAWAIARGVAHQRTGGTCRLFSVPTNRVKEPATRRMQGSKHACSKQKKHLAAGRCTRGIRFCLHIVFPGIHLQLRLNELKIEN